MSWDIFFQDLPNNINSLNEIPNDFIPKDLCSREYYIKMMKELFPNADFSELSWIRLHESTFSIEFSSGNKDKIDYVTLHVRGDNKSFEAINKILSYTNWRAIDSTSGEVIHKEVSGEGLKIHNSFFEKK